MSSQHAPETRSAYCQTNPLPMPLTQRELEVLQVWLQPGATQFDVANELIIAPCTVNTHLRHIYFKLGVSTRKEAARRYRELFRPK